MRQRAKKVASDINKEASSIVERKLLEKFSSCQVCKEPIESKFGTNTCTKCGAEFEIENPFK